MINQLLTDDAFLSKFSIPQPVTTDSDTIDLKSSLRAAFAAPIFYPPLAESVFAGDTVAIVVQSDLQHPDLVLEALIDVLADFDIAATDITVVFSSTTAHALGIDPQRYQLPPETKDEQPQPLFSLTFGFNDINCQVHDPTNDPGLAYLNATENGEPVYVNRLLVDADVVIPIGFVEPGDDGRQADCVYPEFSGTAGRQRLSQLENTSLACRSEIALANDMLGAFAVLQTVNRPGGELAQVFFGERMRTTGQARQAADELWQFDFDGTVDLVVATIETAAIGQGWDDVVEAILMADRFIDGDGPVVVLSEISDQPNRKIRRAMLSQFDDGPEQKASEKLRSLATVVHRRPIYFKSNLTATQVEDLGLGYLDSVPQINRLAEPYRSGLVIRDAHKCQVLVSE